MPKILLEHQLPSNAAPYRRRHSSNTYLGLSPQKRQRVAAVAAATLCFLFLFTLSTRSSVTVGGREGDAADLGYKTPVRAQSVLLFGGLQPLPHILDPAGEYDSSGGRVEKAGKADAKAAMEADTQLDNDAVEEAELSIEEQEALYFSPAGMSP